jgi:hypothetical protein
MAAFTPAFSTVSRQSPGAVSRLITAALVDARFRNLLLTNPSAALLDEYNDRLFNLSLEEVELIQSIRATSLSDFANQVVQYQNQKQYGCN